MMSEEDRELKLLSPAGGAPIIYKWPLQQVSRGKCAVDEATELLDTIRWVVAENPCLSEGPLKNSTSNIIISDYASMHALCELYNSEVLLIPNQTNATQPAPASTILLRHILHRVYSHAIYDPEKLNSYQPFSPEVYGETSYEMVDQLIEDVPIRDGDTFLDLGSGVGQIVLQVAAAMKCRRCYGIERSETPCRYAKAMEREFIRWMKFYGKPYSEFKILKGDFLEERFRSIIQQSSMIFVNNFAFGPHLNHQLKERFALLPEGVRIVSSCEFRPINFRITTRNITDVATIMRVREIQPKAKGSVSWTNNDVNYYIHTLDRSYLEEYIRNQRYKYGDKLDSLFQNADRKIRDKREDEVPALQPADDKRLHVISHIRELEVPEITSLNQMQAILNTHLEDYTLQASSSYGEAALGVEVEEAKALKEHLEEQMVSMQREVTHCQNSVLAMLDKRLTNLGITARDTAGVSKAMMLHVSSFKHLHRRLDRLRSDIDHLSGSVTSSLRTEVSTWMCQSAELEECCAEVSVRQKDNTKLISQIPAVEPTELATRCLDALKAHTERAASMTQLEESIVSMEREKRQLERELQHRADNLRKKQEEKQRAHEEQQRLLEEQRAKSAIHKPTKTLSELSNKRHKKEHRNHSSPEPLRTKKEEPIFVNDTSKINHNEAGKMSHIDSILAHHGFGQYISNDYDKKRKEHHITLPLTKEVSLSKDMPDTPRPPSAQPVSSQSAVNKHHMTILQQQKQLLLQQQQTLAQQEQQKQLLSAHPPAHLPAPAHPSYPPAAAHPSSHHTAPTTPVRPDEVLVTKIPQPSPVYNRETPPPSHLPTHPAAQPDKLRTTSPRPPPKQPASQTVMVPHYLLNKGYVHNSGAKLDPSLQHPAHNPATAQHSVAHPAASHPGPPPPTANPAAAQPSPSPRPQQSKPLVPPGAVPGVSTAPNSGSYRDIGGTHSLNAKSDSAFMLPKDQEGNVLRTQNITKPKHKYPFQFLHHVYKTGYGIMMYNLSSHHPNLPQAVYGELLKKSNFNPYTYYEYLSKCENFQTSLNNFYSIHPEIGVKVGPGPSSKPEPPHPVPKEQQRPVVKDPPPHPLARLNKEPHPLPRAPPTPIETFVVPQKERALSLTKPVKDPYNVKDKLKSPPGNMFKSYHSYESPTKSPAKRSESGLQYHHLSVDSFKQDAKSKVRRRKTSSSDRARAEGVRSEGERVRNMSEGERARNISEHDKPSPLAVMSPSEKISPVKKVDDPEVAEAAMLIVQFTQAFQKKHPDQEEKQETTSPVYPATSAPSYPPSSSAYPVSAATASYPGPNHIPKVENTAPQPPAALKPDPSPQSNHAPVSHPAPSNKKPPTPTPASNPPTSSYAPSNHMPSPSFNHKKEPPHPPAMNGPTLKRSPLSSPVPTPKIPTSNHAPTANHAPSKSMTSSLNHAPSKLVPTSNHAPSKAPSVNHVPSKTSTSNHAPSKTSTSSSKPSSVKSEGTSRKHPGHTNNDAPAKIPKLNNHHSDPKENTKMPVVTKTKHESLHHSEQPSKVPKLEREGARDEYKSSSEVRKEHHEKRGEECKKVLKKEKEDSGKEEKERDFKQERDNKKERDQKKERDSKKFIPPEGAPALRPNPSKPNVAAHPPLLSQPLLSPRATGLPPLKTPRHLEYIGRDVPCQPPVMRMAPTHKKHRDNTKIQVKVAHKPSGSKHPSSKSPHPSSKSPHTSSKSPHPSSKSPLPLNKSPHPSNKSSNLHPSTKPKSPHPSAKSSPAHTPPPPPPPPPPPSLLEENTSSPELVIEEGATSPQTIKASPDSSNLDIMSAQQQSPDSTQRHDNQIFNGEGNGLGYVLEDVSPPSTSPNHYHEGIMDTFLSKKPKPHQIERTPSEESKKGLTTSRPSDVIKNSDTTDESKQLGGDKRPIQSQDLSSSSNDVKNTVEPDSSLRKNNVN